MPPSRPQNLAATFAICERCLQRTATKARSTATLATAACTRALISISSRRTASPSSGSLWKRRPTLSWATVAPSPANTVTVNRAPSCFPKMFGPELVQAFRDFKSTWDPDWKMNPGKLIEPYKLDENLRLGAAYSPWEPKTNFQFPGDHGSLAHNCRPRSSPVSRSRPGLTIAEKRVPQDGRIQIKVGRQADRSACLDAATTTARASSCVFSTRKAHARPARARFFER